MTAVMNPRLDVRLNNEKDDQFTISFQPSLLNSEKFEFSVNVKNVEEYPNDHMFQFALKSSSESEIGVGLLESLSEIDTHGTIKQLIESAGSILAHRATYGATSIRVPDDKTTVVAVLGSSDLANNDWFASDFCLLHKALGGTAKQEVWLTCDSLPDLVKTYKELLHGSPRRTPRRVVFDKNSEDFTMQVDADKLAGAFLEQVEQASLNVFPGERILIVMIAHGQRVTGDLEIGDEYVTRAQVELRLAGIKNGVEITIISTSCFSGIWAMPFKNPRITVLAASTADQPSYSFPASESGYCRGGPFVQTVVNEFARLLQDREEPLDDLQDYPQTDILNRTIRISDVQCKTPCSTPVGQFKSYANRVLDSVKTLQQHPATITFHDEIGEQQASKVLGGSKSSDEITTLFRIGAVLELPKEANYSSIPLAVERVTSQRKTAGKLGPWAVKAQTLYELHAKQSPGPDGLVENISVSRYAARVAEGILPENKCKELVRQIQMRMQSDDEAQRIVTMLSKNFRQDLPQITNWCRTNQTWKTPALEAERKYQPALATFPCRDIRYTKPLHFISWAATECDAAVKELEDVVQSSLSPQPVVAARDGKHRESVLSTSVSMYDLTSFASHLSTTATNVFQIFTP
ncbi:hypothetical protein BD410DRAFT_826881 [Rickenella mellea]|uniref:Peptidase C13 family protein n=1 Tax=Rickenella mellea TaxID=50990 RepID=A0A4Y7QDK5_9AGAM|nr:hypothetical protein BD410DRAFT_826881 [Rickenella mellea]